MKSYFLRLSDESATGERCLSSQMSAGRSPIGPRLARALDTKGETSKMQHLTKDTYGRSRPNGKEAKEVKSKRLVPGNTLNLEKFIDILETPFDEVCQVLGVDCAEPTGFLEIEDCIFLFDSQNGHVLSGAVIMSKAYGFFGVAVGASWLGTAGRLESQGFVQAGDLERFTKEGSDFSISVYLYPDGSPDVSLSKVRDYTVRARHGRAL
jgi:hypothetical protein